MGRCDFLIYNKSMTKAYPDMKHLSAEEDQFFQQ